MSVTIADEIRALMHDHFRVGYLTGLTQLRDQLSEFQFDEDDDHPLQVRWSIAGQRSQTETVIYWIDQLIKAKCK